MLSAHGWWHNPPLTATTPDNNGQECRWPPHQWKMASIQEWTQATTMICVAQGWTWKCETRGTRIKGLRKNPKHLTLTHTLYTHPTTILVQIRAFDIEKYHLCLKSQLFCFITGFIYLITSVVLRPYKWLDTLGVMYKSSMEWSLSFWDFEFQVLQFFPTVFFMMHKVTTSTQAFVTPLCFYYAYTLQNKIYKFAALSNKILFSKTSNLKYVDSPACWLCTHNIS